MGAKDTQKIVDGQVWRLVIPMFLHAGLVHLLLNMAVLLRLGPQMEAEYGVGKFIALYFLSGISGNIWSAVFLPDVLGVGASVSGEHVGRA